MLKILVLLALTSVIVPAHALEGCVRSMKCSPAYKRVASEDNRKAIDSYELWIRINVQGRDVDEFRGLFSVSEKTDSYQASLACRQKLDDLAADAQYCQ